MNDLGLLKPWFLYKSLLIFITLIHRIGQAHGHLTRPSNNVSLSVSGNCLYASMEKMLRKDVFSISGDSLSFSCLDICPSCHPSPIILGQSLSFTLWYSSLVASKFNHFWQISLLRLDIHPSWDPSSINSSLFQVTFSFLRLDIHPSWDHSAKLFDPLRFTHLGTKQLTGLFFLWIRVLTMRPIS